MQIRFLLVVRKKQFGKLLLEQILDILYNLATVLDFYGYHVLML